MRTMNKKHDRPATETIKNYLFIIMRMRKRFLLDNKTNFAIVLFLILFGLLHVVKPAALYNPQGGFREFGVGYRNKTIFPVWIVAILLAIFCYLAVSYWISTYG